MGYRFFIEVKKVVNKKNSDVAIYLRSVSGIHSNRMEKVANLSVNFHFGERNGLYNLEAINRVNTDLVVFKEIFIINLNHLKNVENLDFSIQGIELTEALCPEQDFIVENEIVYHNLICAIYSLNYHLFATV